MGVLNDLVRRQADYDDPNSLGSRMRRARSHHLLETIERAGAQGDPVRILDIGGTRRFWNAIPGDVLDTHEVHITLLNTTAEVGAESDSRFQFAVGNGCDLNEFEDSSFDIAHSNSVIEHVGGWNEMRAFANEVRRVGRSYVVQTPYFWCPFEPHFMFPFFHWLPFSIRTGLVMRYSLGHHQRSETLDAAIEKVRSASLLDRRMFSAAFPDAVHHTERIAGVPKSLIAVRASQ